jgi:hypothetical protein
MDTKSVFHPIACICACTCTFLVPPGGGVVRTSLRFVLCSELSAPFLTLFFDLFFAGFFVTCVVEICFEGKILSLCWKCFCWFLLELMFCFFRFEGRFLSSDLLLVATK